MFIIIRHHN